MPVPAPRKPRHEFRRAALVLIALLVTPAAAVADDRPLVVATTSILGDVAREVAGPDAVVETLMPPGADPHMFMPSARQASRLMRADVVVANGLNLEEGVRGLLEQAKEAGVPTLEVAPLVGPIDGPSGTPDPHVWTDPLRIARGAQHVTAVIARRVHPSRRAAVVARGDAYVRALRADHRWIARRLKGLPPARRVLVTNHHVLGYFAERYRFRVIGTIIPGQSTLASPSAADLAELAATIRRQRVRAIFIDSSSPRRLADALAELAGLRVQVITLYSESLGPPGSSGATYRRMIRTNADRIAKGLGAPKPPS